jgi:hypothetical protein
MEVGSSKIHKKSLEIGNQHVYIEDRGDEKKRREEKKSEKF